MGINVVESEEQYEGAQPEKAPAAALEEKKEARAGGNLDDADIGRTDDPVRMYLREMGSVELLSREGEIAIAKRIEAGRDMMIGGIAESPLTYRAVLEWRERLGRGEMLLRDIIDLDATYGGTAAAAMGAEDSGLGEAAEAEGDGEIEAEAPGAEGGEGEGERESGEEANISLAAMEQELLPSVVDALDKTALAFKKLEKLLKKRLGMANEGRETATEGAKPVVTTDRKIAQLTAKLAQHMGAIKLNNLCIEQLVEQVYNLNRKLIGLEGQLLRLAQKAGVEREGHRPLHRLGAQPALARQPRRADRQGLAQLQRQASRGGQEPARPDPGDRRGDTAADPRVLPGRAHHPEGRARGEPGEERDGGGEPPQPPIPNTPRRYDPGLKPVARPFMPERIEGCSGGPSRASGMEDGPWRSIARVLSRLIRRS